MSEGVEWALHSCLNLSWVEDGESMKAARLAAFYGLPPVYLVKQLQALARAGILASVPGPKGGFRIARDPKSMSLLDIVVAIEGPNPAFSCAQILREGPGGSPGIDYTTTCVLSQAMAKADLAWRRELAAVSLHDIRRTVEKRYPGTPARTRDWFSNQPA